MRNICAALSISAFIIGCGGEETPAPKAVAKPVKAEAKPAPAPAPAAKPKPKPAAEPAGAEVTVAADGTASLTIEVGDNMEYSDKRFVVEPGAKVKLTLKHTGNLPKQVMGHNVIILKAGVDLTEFATAAQSAPLEKDHFPEDKADQVIAKSKLIGTGETVVVEFTAPEAGEYDYFCSFPGHWSMMQGKMVVKASAEAPAEKPAEAPAK